MAYSTGGWRTRRRARAAAAGGPLGGELAGVATGAAVPVAAPVAGAVVPAPWWRRRAPVGVGTASAGLVVVAGPKESTPDPGVQRGILPTAPHRTALAVVEPAGELANLDPGLRAKADANAQRPASASTRRAYAHDWARFERWCSTLGARALPASEETVRTHLTALAAGVEGKPGLRLASIERAYASIRVTHARAGHKFGTLESVTFTIRNMAREMTRAQTQKRALELEQIKAATAIVPTDPVGIRNRALLLMGWSIAQRRADIAALDVADLEWTPEGVIVNVRRSKTDQEGHGHRIPVERVPGRWCPVAALEAWLAEIPPEGPIARRIRHGVLGERMSGDDVAEVVKGAAASIGLDPDLYGGHSLRRGYVTSAKKNGRDIDDIMRITGHESVEQVRKYIEHADPFGTPTASSMLAEPETASLVSIFADAVTVEAPPADPVDALWRSARGVRKPKATAPDT